MEDKHIYRWLRENPGMNPLVEADEETRELLIAAAKRKYIRFVEAPAGELCYTMEDVEQARMWKEKGCLND